MNDLNPTRLFEKWRKKIKQEDICSIYKADERSYYLELLVKAFKKAGFSYDDVIVFKNDIMLALTTFEGRKGNGKHKGWKEQVIQDFQDTLADHYVPDSVLNVEDIKRASLEEKESWMIYQDIDGSVKEWVTKKYGFSEAKYKLACIIGHVINVQYFQEVLGIDKEVFGSFLEL